VNGAQQTTFAQQAARGGPFASAVFYGHANIITNDDYNFFSPWKATETSAFQHPDFAHVRLKVLAKNSHRASIMSSCLPD
jgi:hypothetical protein